MYFFLFRIIFFILLFINLGKAKEIKTQSKITAVTVYRNNAMVIRKATVSLPSGQHQVVFSELSPFVLENTLNVGGKGSDKAIILSAFFRKSFPKEEKNPKLRAINDSIDYYVKKKEYLKAQQGVLQKQKEMLLANKSIKGQNQSLTLTQLQEIYKFFSEQMQIIEDKRFQIREKIKKIQIQLNRLRKQREEMDRLWKQRKTLGEIVITINTSQSVTLTLKVQYLVNRAGWEPEYVLRSEGVAKPLRLSLYAKVRQTTGIDWNKVPILEISTADPQNYIHLPRLTPIWLSFYTPPRSVTSKYKSESIEEADDFGFGEDSFSEEEEAPTPEPQSNIRKSSEFVSLDNQGIQKRFTVKLPYTITSSGKTYLISLTEQTVPTDYQYIAIPSKASVTFLTATLKNWSQYALTRGKARIFFANQFVGEITLDPSIAEDSLTISLGTDPDVVVKREVIKQHSTKKIIGTNIREQKGFEISVRNNKTQDIKIKILDQIPLSTSNHIEVTLIKAEKKSHYNENKGELTWDFNLAPNKTKKFLLIYEIKYPKGKTLIIR